MLNKEAMKMFNVNEQLYRRWCTQNKKSMHKRSTKALFFDLLYRHKLRLNDEGELIECSH